MNLMRRWNNYLITDTDLSGKVPEGLETIFVYKIYFYNESGGVLEDSCLAIFDRSVYQNTTSCFSDLQDSVYQKYANTDYFAVSEFIGMQDATIRRVPNFSRKENFVILKPMGKRYSFESDVHRHAWREGDLYLYVTPETFYESRPRKFSWLSENGQEQYHETTRFYAFKPEGAESERELLIGVNRRETVKTPAGQYVANVRGFLAKYLTDSYISDSNVLEVIRHKDELIDILLRRNSQSAAS